MRTQTTLSAILLATLLTFTLARADFSHSKIQQTYGQGIERIDLIADQAEYNWGSGADANWATFRGNVVIRCNGNELHAEEVRFNAKTHDAAAKGKVVLLGANGEMWTGNEITVDMTNPEFPSVQASDMLVYYAPYRLEVGKGGVRNGSYYAEDVTFTTCTNAPGHRHYEFHARDAVVVPDDDLTAHGAVPYLFGVPFFYWPYFWKDLHNHYGFRFEPGYRSRWGVYLLTTYKMRIWRYDNENWGDSRTSFDLRSKRGLALGEKINWYDTDVGEGWLSVYGLSDQYKEKKLLRDGIEDTDRYRIRLNHALDLTDSDRLLVQGIYLSDKMFLRDFFEDEYDVMPQPENYISLTHTADTWSWGLEADVRLNDFYNQVERLPEAWLSINQREIGGTGLFYESDHSAAYLRRLFDEDRYSDADEREYDAGRLDTEHTLSYPLKIAGFLSLVPSVSWRGTFYSKTKETEERDEVSITSLTNAYGTVYSYPVTNEVSYTEEGDADFRNVLRFGLDLSFKAYGMWTAPDGTPWRHVVEPYAEYVYIPEPNLVPEDLYRFDAVDEIDFTHKVRIGVRNRWQCKVPEVAPGGALRYNRVREFLYVNTYGDIRIEPEDDEKTLSLLGMESVYRPTDWLRAKLDVAYDPEESEISRITSLLEINSDEFRVTGEYIYRVDANSLLMGEIAWKATEKWEFAVFGRYDFESSLCEKVGSYVQMNFDCISLRLIGSVYPGYTRSDGIREEDDYRISFSLWENHFPPANIDKTHY